MNKYIRVKKAFTLVEIILVMILASIIAYITLTGFNFNTQKKYKVNLETIKEFMLKNFEFKKELTLSCFEEDSLNCYIFIDGNISREIKIENLFSQIPTVYNYDRNLSEYSISKVKINDTEYQPFFELKINSDKKHNNLVLDTLDEKVYLFSSISKNVKVFDTTNEIIDRFFDMEIEVKDAL